MTPDLCDVRHTAVNVRAGVWSTDVRANRAPARPPHAPRAPDRHLDAPGAVVPRPGPASVRADVHAPKSPTKGPGSSLADPDLVKQVFTGDPKVFHAGEGNDILRPLLGEHSLLTLDEAPHISQRKPPLPSLHGKRMAGYEETMRRSRRARSRAGPPASPPAGARGCRR